MKISVACLFCLLLTMSVVPSVLAGAQPAAGPRASVDSVSPEQKSPLVIIYTLSTCPHCAEAKDFFTRNNIPFVNREVDTDSQYMDELMQIYDTLKIPDQKRGVPLILIGDSIKLQGFNEEKVREAIKKIK